MIETWNFKEQEYDYNYPSNCSGVYEDIRNGIRCHNPSGDLQCYFNYLDLLNERRNEWKSWGYLDLGMMPLVMGPSFMQAGLSNLILDKVGKLDLKVYRLPPVSLLYTSRKLPFKDIWVFKEDAVKLMGIESEKITAEQFLRWVFRDELNRVK